MDSRSSLLWQRSAVLLFLFSAAVLASGAQQTPKPKPPANIPELVKKAVANEARAANDDVKLMYCVHRQTPKGTETREYIETKDGTAGMLLAENDQPLDAQRQQQEWQRLEDLEKNPAEMMRKKRQQKEDSDRELRMVTALPQAFTYEYVNTETKDGDELVKLKFKPNPDFDPPSRELQVFTGMNGFLVIDATRERIAEINGTLFKDVNFGWGILGHLNRGGRFVVVQGSVADGYWTTTHLQLNFTGKALFFHSINIQSTEDSSGFQRVPHNLTYAEGVTLLKKKEAVVADNEGVSRGGK
jgi:hypothetical protein